MNNKLFTWSNLRSSDINNALTLFLIKLINVIWFIYWRVLLELFLCFSWWNYMTNMNAIMQTVITSKLWSHINNRILNHWLWCMSYVAIIHYFYGFVLYCVFTTKRRLQIWVCKIRFWFNLWKVASVQSRDKRLLSIIILKILFWWKIVVKVLCVKWLDHLIFMTHSIVKYSRMIKIFLWLSQSR